MYSTCLHCHASLGSNQSIEAFPVGKRLAFDAAKGRLWVICPSCGRWNLTPLEERWEAVEDCERQFRDARQRVSKGEIGLAHLSSGVGLVRIGVPPATEMAAWRYGRVLRQRWWTRGLPFAALGVSGAGLQFFQGFSPGNIEPFIIAAAGFAGLAFASHAAVKTRIALPDGSLTTVRRMHTGKASLEPDGCDAWALRYERRGRIARLEGLEATHALRGFLTMANYTGAPRREIDSAVELLSQAGSPSTFLRRLARASDSTGVRALHQFPADIRCALEMALHDESERKAMEGELDDLLAEWRRAEEIASIADNLLTEPVATAKAEA